MSTQITLPDIGEIDSAEIIDIAVSTGDTVQAEDILLTLESDKATIDIPAPFSGTIESLLVKIGDRINIGDPIAVLNKAVEKESAESAESAKATPTKNATTVLEEPPQPPPATASPSPSAALSNAARKPPPNAPIGARIVGDSHSEKAHASPSVRRFARELGVDLGLVYGTGPKQRITKDDVKAFTKSVLSSNKLSSGNHALPEIPPVDFSKFGTVEMRKLSRLKQLGGQLLQRSWFSVPHVTQFDEADISDLEEFRKAHLEDAQKRGIKLTIVPFLVKAVIDALQQYPEFNSSLTTNGEGIFLKKYFHIGIAVNTDEGLIVPVLRDANQKGLFQIAKELADLSEKARTGKIVPADLQGGCFTISSLGGIGGKHFSPIINAPEVAILGVSRAAIQPKWIDDTFVPRLIIPLSLSYDHRVIDGVAGAQFTRFLSAVLSDIRQILL